MPIYEYRCRCGHTQEHYVHRAEQAPQQYDCDECPQPACAVRQLSAPRTPQYFSESNGQVINNLAPGVPIHSHGQHQRLMKAKGVEPASDWHVSLKPSRM